MTTAEQQPSRDEPLVKLTRWFFFGVVIAIIPIGMTYFLGWTTDHAITFATGLSGGELLLVSVIISAAAAGELFGNGETADKWARMFLIGLSLAIAILAAIWFGEIASTLAAKQSVDADVVMIGSLVIFGSSVLSGGACIWKSVAA